MSEAFDRYLDASEALGQDAGSPNPLICPHCAALLREVEKRREENPGFVERVRQRVEHDAELMRLLADS